MATHYICDRCHSTHTQKKDVTEFNYTWTYNDYNESERYIRYDLCYTCMKALEDFVKPLAKANQ